MMMPGRQRDDANKGGKLILPSSALDQLTRLNISYPMLFSVYNAKTGRRTHCGVLEFVAEEGLAHMPHWMMQNLGLAEGDQITIASSHMPVATFAKFEPQSVDFLQITNPKAVLENTLRSWSCLTEEDIISIPYNGKEYEFKVLEVKPKDPCKAVSIVECDLELDFAPPVGYVDPSIAHRANKEAQAAAAEVAAQAKVEADVKAIEEEEKKAVDKAVFQTFSGAGARLDGKATRQKEFVPVVQGGIVSADEKKKKLREARAAAAMARFKPGKLSFSTNSVAAAQETAKTTEAAAMATGPEGGATSDSASKKDAGGFVSFGGAGHTLR